MEGVQQTLWMTTRTYRAPFGIIKNTGHVEVSLKWGFEPRVTLGGTLNEQNLE